MNISVYVCMLCNMCNCVSDKQDEQLHTYTIHKGVLA